METKDFNNWMKLKASLHYAGVFRNIKEGDVWWCSMGENIGVEINGKQKLFLRPVLVLKKLSKYGFLGVPLTSQVHDGIWYTAFGFKNKTQYAALAQIRTMSVYRLCRKMGTVPNNDLEMVRDGFKRLYC